MNTIRVAGIAGMLRARCWSIDTYGWLAAAIAIMTGKTHYPCWSAIVLNPVMSLFASVAGSMLPATLGRGLRACSERGFHDYLHILDDPALKGGGLRALYCLRDACFSTHSGGYYKSMGTSGLFAFGQTGSSRMGKRTDCT